MKTENHITIDLSYLHMVAGGDKLFEKKLLESTIDDIEAKVNNLEEALQAEDANNIRMNAHSLKSLTAIAGIPQMQFWSKSVDKLFADGIFDSKTHEPVLSIIKNWTFAKLKLQKMLTVF
jgi:HPt (histidine-containing phosphotransfer) domain-containing protein